MTGIFLSSSQDILSVIRKQGPSTEGIFVIAPEETSCKALKEKLGRTVTARPCMVSGDTAGSQQQTPLFSKHGPEMGYIHHTGLRKVLKETEAGSETGRLYVTSSW